MSVLSAKHFHDEKAAYRFLEAQIWPDGPVCPHCGGFDRIGKLEGESTRIGVHKCYQCRKPFTVKVGTVFESSHVKLHLWLQAAFLMCSSKKGISSNQLHRTLGVTLKTAWFMSHRLREAMRDTSTEPMGGEGKTVEADETYFGKRKGVKKIGPGGQHRGMMAVVGLVQRGGKVRTFHVDKANKASVLGIVTDNVRRETTLHTDESYYYKGADKIVAKHETVVHSKDEYVRGAVTTNTVEGYFAIFKRGMKGVYQHCDEKHLHRYLSEFDFRYNERVALGVDDLQRTSKALGGIVGKRLTYRRTDGKVKKPSPVNGL